MEEGLHDSKRQMHFQVCAAFTVLLRSMSDVRMHVDMHPPPLPPPTTVSSHIPPPSPQVTASCSTVLVSLSFSVFKLGYYILYFPRSECYTSKDKMRSIVRALHSTIRSKTRLLYSHTHLLLAEECSCGQTENS